MTATRIDPAATAREAHALKEAVHVTQRRIYELLADLKAYMLAEEATRIPDAELDISLRPGTPTWNVNQLMAELGELLPPIDYKKVFPEPGPCNRCGGSGLEPRKVDGVQVNRVRRYGAEYAEKIDAACVRGESTVVITERKGGKS